MIFTEFCSDRTITVIQGNGYEWKTAKRGCQNVVFATGYADTYEEAMTDAKNSWMAHEERCSTCGQISTNCRPEFEWPDRATMYRAQTVSVFCEKCHPEYPKRQGGAA